MRISRKEHCVATYVILGSFCAISFLHTRPALAQAKHKVTLQNGHVSPLSARITYADGSTRDVMALGIGAGDSYSPHAIMVFGEGDAKVTIWLDSIRRIQNVTEEDGVIILKDGTERHIEWQWNDQSARSLHGSVMDKSVNRTLFFSNPQDVDEKVDLAKVKSVEFLAPARKDKDGNAMFDLWRYSPFTGEKLPER